jgi:very-short-patch-repair endonuclease
MLQCEKCKRKFKKNKSLLQHFCSFDENKIQEAMNEYISKKLSFYQLYKLYKINAVYAKERLIKQSKFRSLSESISEGRKKINFHLTDEQKAHLSKKRKQYLKLHPYENAWKRGTISYGEKLFKNLIERLNLTEKYDIIREFSIYPYYLDFAFLNIKLNVEIDSSIHWTEKGLKYDSKRDKFLISQGWKIYRIPYFKLKSLEFDNMFKKYLELIEIQPKICSFSKDVIENKEFQKNKNAQRQKEWQEELLKKKQQKIETFKNNFLNIKNVDFSKFGWLSKISEILQISHTHIKRLLKLHFPEILQIAFKKRKFLEL